jgi:hypothetical protein
MGKTDFTFIDNAAIDQPESRRVIRSQVMKGRNLGRILPKRTRRTKRDATRSEDGGDAQDAAAAVKVTTQKSKPQRQTQSPSQSVSPTLSQEISAIPYAAQITPHDRETGFNFFNMYMGFAYPTKICAPTFTDYLYFDYLFHNEAFYHTWMAAAYILPGCFMGKRDAPGTDFRRHIVRALQLINRNISNDHDVSDGTIACVIVLCGISLLTETPAQTRVHFDGLLRILQVRGGLHKLGSASILGHEAQLIDVTLAYHLGCEPRLKTSPKRIETVLPASFDTSPVYASPLLSYLSDTPEFYEAAVEVLKLSHIFNSCVEDTSVTQEQHKLFAVQLRYGLSEMFIEGESTLQNPVAKAIHLGLFAFTVTLDRIYTGASYKKLVVTLKHVLDDPAFQSAIDLHTHLWLLMVVSISVADAEDIAWLVPRIKIIVEQFGRQDWYFARQIFAAYPWTTCLHDQQGFMFWGSMFPELNVSIRVVSPQSSAHEEEVDREGLVPLADKCGSGSWETETSPASFT